MAGEQRLPAIQEVEARCRKIKKKTKPSSLFLYPGLPFYFFYLVTFLSFPSLSSQPVRRQLQAGQPPVPCFMHEDDGAVIYPVSAPRHRSCLHNGWGRAGVSVCTEEWPEMGTLSAGRIEDGRSAARNMEQVWWGPNQGSNPHILESMIYLLLCL